MTQELVMQVVEKPFLYRDRNGQAVHRGDLVTHRSWGFIPFVPVNGYADSLEIIAPGHLFPRRILVIRGYELGDRDAVTARVNADKYVLSSKTDFATPPRRPGN